MDLSIKSSNFFNNSVKFSARNSEIRFADDVVRKLNNEFLRISSTKVETFNNAKKFPKVISSLSEDINSIRGRINFIKKSDFPMNDSLNLMLGFLKGLHRGNCGESANLAVIAAKMNGITNCKKVSLVNKAGDDFDHIVVLVDGKKPYIIDAWLGFADYIPNAFQRYKKDYSHCFDFARLGDEMSILTHPHWWINRVPQENINNLKKTYPGLLLKMENI